MKKLLVICGPTATGKTLLGIRLAKKFDGEIISADSRQVYRGMDIGTGKEWGEVPIWGYDLVYPRDEFSVGQYLKVVSKIIKDIEKRDKLPILVGGTGLYVKGVVDGIPTAQIPKNRRLRKNLEGKSTTELFGLLANLDSIKAGSMNSSDVKNPARLIRAIEISQYNLTNGQISIYRCVDDSCDVLFVGLTASPQLLNRNVEKSVERRLKNGIKEEIKKLLKLGVDWHNQSMMALGYRQWRDFFEAGVEEEQVVSEWKREETQYVRRQMTWFKKDPRINWFDIQDKDFPKNVEKLVKKWHNG